ncbi:MAG TPA: hypothetical protein VMT62_00620 [Syntrophorhabdaceae bacterium]|nr:hypothetical protein [Syntrophorhabdaceae bacterium]
MKRFVVFAVILLFASLPCFVRADVLPLVNNGNGLIYDPNLNITWLDYTYFGPSSGTLATWSDAMAWASGLNAGGVTGWRLPHALPVNGSTYNYTFSANGSTDFGYNISSPNSEMAYLYYVELGNKGYYAPDGSYPQPGWGLTNTGYFSQLYWGSYWSGTPFDQDPTYAWFFRFDGGRQEAGPDSTTLIALAVHDGDVGGLGVPAPIPSVLLLFAPGIAGIIAIRKRWGNL